MSSAQAAEALEAHTSNAQTEQFLSFMLADEEYGIDILQVQEIRGWEHVTPIPNTPEYIKGVMNLRGTIVPVVDLRLRFKMDAADYSPTTVVIVLRISSEKGDRTVGIVVDAVSEVYDVALDELKSPPDLGGSISTEFMQGLATVEEKMVILLDINGLITEAVLDELVDADA